MNGSDTWSFIDITAFTDSNHTGSTNVLNGINIGAITSPDANANHVAVNIGSGWDNPILIAGVAFASLGDPADGVIQYCTDCLAGSAPCSGSSTGALAVQQGNAWKCL
jgi:hypothetical protein